MKDARELLSLLLIISYICGLRIIKFQVGDPKQWFSFVYMLLLWTFYSFIIIYTITYKTFFAEYYVCIGLHIFTALISIVIGIYYDKVRNIMKNI